MKKAMLLALLLVGLLPGCQWSTGPVLSATPTLPELVSLDGLSVANYPAVDGSTSALPLQQIVACHIFEIDCDWTEGFLFDSTLSILPAFGEVEGDAEAVEFMFSLEHSGTHDAYLNLIYGDADLILVARQPSADEFKVAERREVTMDYRPVALDAFVFLVNEANPLESIEVAFIRDVYSGRLERWDQLGVDLTVDGDSTIHTYRRNPNSGSQELMEALVMQGEEMIDSPDLLLETMVGPFNAVGSDVLGIGYSVYYYATYMLPVETVRLLPVGGVLPAQETIADASYPFVTEVYVVVRDDLAPESTAMQLRNWLLTAEGQSVVAQSGYIPVGDP